MTPAETTQVLAMFALYDCRFADPHPALVNLWQRTLEGVGYADAVKAAVDHYANSTEKITPDQIRKGGRL